MARGKERRVLMARSACCGISQRPSAMEAGIQRPHLSDHCLCSLSLDRGACRHSFELPCICSSRDLSPPVKTCPYHQIQRFTLSLAGCQPHLISKEYGMRSLAPPLATSGTVWEIEFGDERWRSLKSDHLWRRAGDAAQWSAGGKSEAWLP